MYQLEPWGEEREDRRVMAKIIYTAPPGLKIDMDSLSRAVNPWAENLASAEMPTKKSVAEKVRLFNAGLKGLGTRHK